MAEIKLGDKVRDVYTKLEGYATARYIFLYGCTRIRVEPAELKDGKPVEGQSFDEQRLEVIDSLGAEPGAQISGFKLGDKVRDGLTGYTGIATARYTYQHSTPCVFVESEEMKDGKPIDGVAFAEQRLEVMKARPVENHAPHVPTGGPQPNESHARRPGP